VPSAQEIQTIIGAGIAALRRGDAEEARRLLREAVEMGGPVPPPWFPLAQACRHAGDEAGENEALDKVLEAQPRNVGALIMKGDWYGRAGDKRAASSFYRAALHAAAAAAPPSPLLANELRRAEAAAQALEREFEAHIAQRLTAGGAGELVGGERVRAAIDIMLGRKQIYLQQPTSFYFPGLPQIEFYERADFPWLGPIEAAIPDMRAELEALLEMEDAFNPYVEADPNRPPATNRLLGDPRWSAFYLWKGGDAVSEAAERCPATMAALREAPMPLIRGRSPMALYSLLRPGADIAPHNGLLNTRLICHIPLVVPPDCRLRVGNQVRTWEEGKALIFDDSIEHEAWNRSNRTRVILLFEIWRPEIAEKERRALTAMFEAITDYGGLPPENPARSG
jgi:tetratricopeptide (TPR) repeat protein